MSFNKLNIECIVDSERADVAAKIKRNDGKFYDNSTKSFKDFTGSFLTLSLDSGLASLSVDINPKEFTDGDYNIYCYDMADTNNPRLFDANTVSVFSGSSATQKVPSTTDNAVRILDASVGNSTLRKTLADLTKELAEVQAKLDFVIKQINR